MQLDIHDSTLILLLFALLTFAFGCISTIFITLFYLPSEPESHSKLSRSLFGLVRLRDRHRLTADNPGPGVADCYTYDDYYFDDEDSIWSETRREWLKRSPGHGSLDADLRHDLRPDLRPDLLHMNRNNMNGNMRESDSRRESNPHFDHPPEMLVEKSDEMAPNIASTYGSTYASTYASTSTWRRNEGLPEPVFEDPPRRFGDGHVSPPEVGAVPAPAPEIPIPITVIQPTNYTPGVSSNVNALKTEPGSLSVFKHVSTTPAIPADKANAENHTRTSKPTRSSRVSRPPFCPFPAPSTSPFPPTSPPPSTLLPSDLPRRVPSPLPQSNPPHSYNPPIHTCPRSRSVRGEEQEQKRGPEYVERWKELQFALSGCYNSPPNDPESEPCLAFGSEDAEKDECVDGDGDQDEHEYGEKDEYDDYCDEVRGVCESKDKDYDHDSDSGDDIDEILRYRFNSGFFSPTMFQFPWI